MPDPLHVPEPPQAPVLAPEPKPPVDPELTKLASKRIVLFGVLLLATLLTSALPLPLQVASVAFAVWAFVAGILALIASWRSGSRGATTPVLSAGLFLTGVLGITMAASFVVWPIQVAFQECMGNAVTITAVEKCKSQQKADANAWVKDLTDRLTGG